MWQEEDEEGNNMFTTIWMKEDSEDKEMREEEVANNVRSLRYTRTLTS
jgi:hypothetical protein